MVLLETPVDGQVQTIIRERTRLASCLPCFPFVRQVFPSDANFLLVRVADADALYAHLLAQGIIVRNRSRVAGCASCLRLTVGLPEENERLLQAMESYDKDNK
jgi:histidinol-phosphate aminotransferase